MKDIDLNAVIAEAVMKSLEDEKKDKLIQAAIESLIKGKDQYSGSKLQAIFEAAVYQTAKKRAEEMILSSEFQLKINEILSKGFQKLLTEKLDELTSNLADGIVKAFKISSY